MNEIVTFLGVAVVSDLGNPKMAAFFTSLLPAAYAAAIDRLGHLVRRTGVRRAIEAVTGTVLVGLGVRVALQPLTRGPAGSSRSRRGRKFPTRSRPRRYIGCAHLFTSCLNGSIRA